MGARMTPPPTTMPHALNCGCPFRDIACPRLPESERYPKMPESEQHETIGHVFKSFGYRLRCLRWTNATGFFFRVLSVPDDGETDIFHRKVGDIVDTSERAIGRTYHRDYDDESYEPHEAPCECNIANCGGKP